MAYDQVKDVANGQAAGSDKLGSYRIENLPTVQTSSKSEKDTQFLDTSKDFPLAQKSDAGQKPGERPMLTTDKQVEDLAKYFSGAIKDGDTRGNERACEWLRNRFEEEMQSGGNANKMEQKMNEALAKDGLSVKFIPNTYNHKPYRESGLEVSNTKITVNDLSGKPVHPVMAGAYGAGMPVYNRK